jgi:hypothetical protein
VTIELPYKMGLISDHQPPVVPDLATFAIESQPTPPPSVPAPQTPWSMACNDKEGDCTIAGATHVNAAGAFIVGEPYTYQGDPATSAEYLKLTGGPDTGLMLPQVLVPWHEGTGLWEQGPNGGFVSINPKNTTSVKRGIWIFGNTYIAVNLPAVAQQQFRPDGSGVWELTHSDADFDIAGGHCVCPVGYSAEGITAVTWGSTVLITYQWWATYVSQVYAVVPPAFVLKGGDGRGYNLAAIDAYLPKAA